MKRNYKTKLGKWNETGKRNETKKRKRKNEIKRTIRKEKWTIRKKHEIKWTIRKKNRNFYCLAGTSRFCRLFRFCLAGSSQFCLAGSSWFCLVFCIYLIVGKLRFLLRVCLNSKKVNILNINLKNHVNVFNYYLAYLRIESWRGRIIFS